MSGARRRPTRTGMARRRIESGWGYQDTRSMAHNSDIVFPDPKLMDVDRYTKCRLLDLKSRILLFMIHPNSLAVTPEVKCVIIRAPLRRSQFPGSIGFDTRRSTPDALYIRSDGNKRFAQKHGSAEVLPPPSDVPPPGRFVFRRGLMPSSKVTERRNCIDESC